MPKVTRQRKKQTKAAVLKECNLGFSTQPTAIRRCNGKIIDTTMLQDADVKKKLYNYFMEEVFNCNVDNARNILEHFPWLATEKTASQCPMEAAALFMHLPMMKLLSQYGATMFNARDNGTMPIDAFYYSVQKRALRLSTESDDEDESDYEDDEDDEDNVII